MESSLSVFSTNLSLQDASSGPPTSPRKKSLNSISPELFVENLPKIESSNDASIGFYTRSQSVKLSNEDSKENMQTPFQTIAGSSSKRSSFRPRSNDISIENRPRSNDIVFEDSEIKDSTTTDITKKKRTTSTNGSKLSAVAEDISPRSSPILSITNREIISEIPLRRSRNKIDERLKLNPDNINEIFQAPITLEGSLSPSSLLAPLYLSQPDLSNPKKSSSRDHSPLSSGSRDTSPRVSFATQSDQSSSKSSSRDHSPLKTLVPDTIQISSSGLFRLKRRVSREELPFNINQNKSVVETNKIETKDLEKINNVELVSVQVFNQQVENKKNDEEKLTSMNKDDSCNNEYISEKKKEPSENKLLSSFTAFAKKCESKANLESKTNDDYIDKKIKKYASKQKERFVELGEVCVGPNEIQSQFKNMHSSYDTQDIIRHIIRGQVRIKNNGMDQKDLEINDIAELDDLEQVVSLTARIEAILKSFEKRVTLYQFNYDLVNLEDKQILEADIKSLIGELKNIDLCKTSEDVTKILSKSLKKWNTGTPSQKNMARLLHAMRQEYDTIRLQPITALISDQGSECPRRLLDIKSELKQDKNKIIEFEFGENKVKVTHSINLKEKDTTKSLTITLFATLKAPLHDLENWTFIEELHINALKKSEVGEAKKLNRLFINTGYTSCLIPIKES